MPPPLIDVRIPRSLAFDVNSVATVTVRRNNEMKNFTICAPLIAQRSEYFNEALQGQWRTEKRSVELTGVRPADFSLYCQLLYTSKLLINPAYDEESTDYTETPSDLSDENDQEDLLFHHLSDVYVAAHKVRDTITKNLLTDAALAHFREAPSEYEFDVEFDEEADEGFTKLPGSGVVCDVYNGTNKACKLRRLIVDIYRVYGPSIKIIEMQLKIFPKQFLRDLVASMKEDPDNEWDVQTCDPTTYHEEPVEF
ncbi:hypothetical protein P154DRAFT_568772 [Amniculicola lignicola CBS 123094]|uniref:BTB domain-containing protein n=1 Tax=Amniculicola lignicola CBS 123094 TaxID=1392246 RepID=A0A6A5X4Z5_9PLEO|nr:hypothetical protein P154DRAFT_568772 [Amniculicola lignicola CBS 123094]